MNLTKKLNGVIPGKTITLLKEIGKVSKRAGGNAFLVGGAVRDALLGRASRDIDVTIEIPRCCGRNAVLKNIEREIARARDVREPEFHEKFGTAGFLLRDGARVDLVAARKERYAKPGALPEVENGSLDEDLFRRDFTINAVAVSLGGDFGSLRDPYGGLGDLKNKQIRILHGKSFIDDPTRVLRALRFSARLGFRLEKRTQNLLGRAVKGNYLSKVSRERVRNEFLLALEENNSRKCLECFKKYGVKLISAENFSLLEDRRLKGSPAAAKLAALLLGKGARRAKAWLKEMKMSRETTKEINDVFEFMEKRDSRKLPIWADGFFKAAGFTPKKISITGKDLIKFGLKPGPAFGKILKEVNSDKKLKNPEQVKKYVLGKYGSEM